MEYTIFVGIESTQQPYKHNIPFHTIFLSFYNGIYVLCGYWLESTLTQTRYSISKNHLVSVLQWNIRFVWVLSRTQQPHKHDILFRNTIFLAFCHYKICVGIESTQQPQKHDFPLQSTMVLAFCDGIYELCVYWVDWAPTQTRYSFAKHHFFTLIQKLRYFNQHCDKFCPPPLPNLNCQIRAKSPRGGWTQRKASDSINTQKNPENHSPEVLNKVPKNKWNPENPSNHSHTTLKKPPKNQKILLEPLKAPQVHEKVKYTPP